ncbi:SagB family peptide dehydrogenase [Krasilnikovia sp. MM14-A1259]|uniref:SagB family peptide dehydrogenase n=1 Tax=Krasilnikovia sp. MM14-A1259 TaxID=3373539 RepID=UPI0037F6A1CE
MADSAVHHDEPRPRFPLWSFREDVYLETIDPPGETVVVHSRWEDTTLPRPRPAVLEAMRRMSLGPISLDNVIRDDTDRRQLARLLDRVPHLVVRSFGVDREQPLVSVVPLTPQARFRLPTGPLTEPVRLSRFALIRSDGNSFVVESPLSLHRVILHRPEAMAQLGPLMRPVDPARVAPATLVLIHHLMAAGMVVEAASSDAFRPAEFAEDSDPVLATWRPVDLMFHTRSTLGRHDHDFGATYPAGERGNVEPTVKPPLTRHPIRLARPKWDDLVADDTPLTVAIEASQSYRHYATEPVTVDQLGELLYRTARVRSLGRNANEPGGAPEEPAASDRPYLAGGESYELEVYLTVDRCAGLTRGVYHYDPLAHALEPIEVRSADVDELLGTARVAANLSTSPPSLLTITARFRRLSWKYDGLSYSLVLKNVGALTQTLTLVATAMGLGTCRLDSGDVETSPRVFGLDWRAESTVGEFVVGHPAHRPEEPVPGRRPVNDADWPARARTGLL